MSSVTSSITTPGEARQARKLLLSLDLTIVAFWLTLISVGLPVGIGIVGRFVDISALPINQVQTMLFSLVWLGTTVAILTSAAAILLLGTPRAVRCSREAVVYIVLSNITLAYSVLAKIIAVPHYVGSLIFVIQLLLIPLVLLLIYRKVALFVHDLGTKNKCMAALRMLVASILLLQLGRAWVLVPELVAIDPVSSLLVGAVIVALSVLTAIIAWLRLTAIHFTVRRQVALQLDSYRRTNRSEGSTVSSEVEKSSDEMASSDETRWLIYRAVPLLLLLELCVTGGLRWQRSELERKQIAQRQQDQAATALSDIARSQMLREANELNNQVWSVVSKPTGQPSQEMIQKLDEYASRVRQAAFYNTLGVAYYRMGKYQAAKERLQMSMALQSFTATKHPIDYGFMAMSLQQLGQKGEAEKIRQEFNSLMDKPSFQRNEECKSVQKEVEELFGR